MIYKKNNYDKNNDITALIGTSSFDFIMEDWVFGKLILPFFIEQFEPIIFSNSFSF